MTTIADLAADFRTQFPTLDDAAIAALVAQVLAGGTSRRAAPTVTDHLVTVRAMYRERERGRLRAPVGADGQVPVSKTTTYRTYDTHWRRFAEQFGDRHLDTIVASELVTFITSSGVTAQRTQDGHNTTRTKQGLPPLTTNGAAARNSCRSALRALFNVAVADGVLNSNPMNSGVTGLGHEPKPGNNRAAITPEQLDEVLDAAATGGDDPVLDFLLLWTMAEAACRREALLNLQVGDLLAGRQSLRLVEKGDDPAEQPVTAELLNTLRAFATSRGSTQPGDPVFRYHPDGRGQGRALTNKRFETLYKRLRLKLDWVAETGFTGHWLRHTTLTWCERSHGLAVARAYARHRGGPVTLTYTKAGIGEVAQALSTLTNTRHPLAPNSSAAALEATA